MVSDNNNNMTDKNIVNNNNSVLICHMHCVHQNAKLIIPCKVYRDVSIVGRTVCGETYFTQNLP